MDCSRSLIASSILLAAFTSVTAIVESWNYSDQGAWKSVEEWQCDGMRQSPINISTNNLFVNRALIDLKLTNFDQSYAGNFTNTGHSVQFTPGDDSPTASFQNHQGTYELQQFHFHWGNTSVWGSEHTINGGSYAGELHFVTSKTTGNSTAGDAAAVLSVLLISDTSLPSTGSWMQLLNNIPINHLDISSVNGVRPTDLLPDDLSYYYYEGSLTTPPCSEVVQWFLLRNPLKVPSDFLNELRTTVKKADEDLLGMNFRMMQPLNNRRVMIQPKGDGSNGAFRLSGRGLLIFVSLIVCILYF